MMRIAIVLLLILASGCANRPDPVFDGGVYDPIYGAADAQPAENG